MYCIGHIILFLHQGQERDIPEEVLGAVRALPATAGRPDLGAYHRFQGEWLLTPQPYLEGEITLVVVSRERRSLTDSPEANAYLNCYTEREMNDLLVEGISRYFEHIVKLKTKREVNAINVLL